MPAAGKSYAAVVKLEVTQALQDAQKFMTYLDPASETFAEMRQEIERVEAATKLIGKNMTVKSANRLVGNVRDLRDHTMNAAAATEVMTKGFRGSTLASQNLLRIVQDAPYGIMGMANNIQQMAESWAFAKKQGQGFGSFVKDLLRSVTTGPFAIPMAITLLTTLALSWDKIADKVDGVKTALGFLTEAQKAYNDEVRSTRESLSEQVLGGLDLGELAEVERAVNKTGKSLHDFQAEAREMGVALQGPLGAITGTIAGKIWHTFSSDVEEGGEKMSSTSEDVLKFSAAMRGALDSTKAFVAWVEKLDVSRELKQKLLGNIEEVEEEEKKKQKKLIDLTKEIERMKIRATHDGVRERIALVEFEYAERLKRVEQHYTQREQETPGWVREIYRKVRDAEIEEIEKLERERREAARRARDQRLEDLVSEHTSRRVASHERRETGNTFGIRRTTDRALARERIAHDARLDQLENARITAKRLYEKGLIDRLEHDTRMDEIESEREVALKEHEDRKNEITRQGLLERSNIYRQNVAQMAGMYSSASQTLFNVWQTERERDLDALGYTEEQKNEVIQREGKKRFENMKKMMIAEAIINSLNAGTGALVSIWTSPALQGQPWAQAALSATMVPAVIASGYAQVRKIQSMQIGGSASGGASGGIGAAGYKVLDRGVRDQRAEDFAVEQTRDVSVAERSNESLETEVRKLGDRMTGALKESRAIGDDEAARVKARAETYESKAVS